MQCGNLTLGYLFEKFKRGSIQTPLLAGLVAFGALSRIEFSTGQQVAPALYSLALWNLWCAAHCRDNGTWSLAIRLDRGVYGHTREFFLEKTVDCLTQSGILRELSRDVFVGSRLQLAWTLFELDRAEEAVNALRAVREFSQDGNLPSPCKHEVWEFWESSLRSSDTQDPEWLLSIYEMEERVGSLGE